MDGNRRGPKRNGLKTVVWSSWGSGSVRKVVQFCMPKENKISFFIHLFFRKLKRSYEENSIYLVSWCKKRKKGWVNLRKHGIRYALEEIEVSSRKSCAHYWYRRKRNARFRYHFIVTFLLLWRRQEIAKCNKNIALDFSKTKTYGTNALLHELLAVILWTHEFPDPDLIIRTGVFSRIEQLFACIKQPIGNLCFWLQLAGYYTQHLQEAYDSLCKCTRNFGA